MLMFSVATNDYEWSLDQKLSCNFLVPFKFQLVLLLPIFKKYFILLHIILFVWILQKSPNFKLFVLAKSRLSVVLIWVDKIQNYYFCLFNLFTFKL